MEAGTPITKMFQWLQMQPQSEPFLLIITQLPKIYLAGKTDKFTVETVGLSLLVHYIHSLQQRLIQEAASATTLDLLIKADSRQI